MSNAVFTGSVSGHFGASHAGGFRHAECGRGFGIPRIKDKWGAKAQQLGAAELQLAQGKTEESTIVKPQEGVPKARACAKRKPITARGSKEYTTKLSRVEQIALELGVPLTARPTHACERQDLKPRGKRAEAAPYLPYNRCLGGGRSSPKLMAASTESPHRDVFSSRKAQQFLTGARCPHIPNPLVPRSLRVPPQKIFHAGTGPINCSSHSPRTYPSPFALECERHAWIPCNPAQARYQIKNGPTRMLAPREFLPSDTKGLHLGETRTQANQDYVATLQALEPAAEGYAGGVGGVVGPAKPHSTKFVKYVGGWNDPSSCNHLVINQDAPW